MSIIGLTDRPILRRDGKIRAGYKEDGTNKLVNTEHFLLHDAPALQEVLGEKCTEIYFTVHSDNKDDFMKTDLRMYNASQLLCVSMHNAPGADGQPMGAVAAYSGVGADVPGLMQKPFPGMPKARTRSCGYRSCSDYLQGKCSEHMFLDIVVPQCSMGAIFTVDTTSINAILNAHSTFAKAWTRYGGKITGNIFKLYKKPGEISYQKKDGSTGKREAPMIFIDMVNFDEYEAKFRSQVRPEDWEALINLRSRTFAQPLTAGALPPVEDMQALMAGDVGQSTGVPSLMAVPANDEDEVRARANDPSILPLFEEYGTLLGREATESVRIATMRNMSLSEGITYLKNKIKEAKKQKAKTVAEVVETDKGDAPVAAAAGSVSKNTLY